jgi:hydrogenase expression/formation protein HypE
MQEPAPERILVAHGGGGALMRELLDTVVLPAAGGGGGPLPDAAAVPGAADLVFTTDSFVVKPLFFRGGDIGSLAVHGTVNDLAVSGAEPLALSFALILEEGLPLETLRRVVASAGEAARACGVPIVTGDTKVVARGEADGCFVNTAGIGRRVLDVGPDRLRAGDHVLVSGPIAEHGVAIMSQRAGIDFETPVVSDSAPVWPLVRALMDAGVTPRTMRDPTRGGLASACVELAGDSGVSIALREAAIPVRPPVRAACDMLGLDPLTVANEGRLLAFVPEGQAAKALRTLRALPAGADAADIGAVVERGSVPVTLTTPYGGVRVVELPYGEDLPRIC